MKTAKYANEQNTKIILTYSGKSTEVPVNVNNAVYNKIISDGIEIGPYEPVVTSTIPISITRRQCAIELRERGLITDQEALNMTKYGDIPSIVEQVFAQMSADDRIKAETDFAANTYMRSNPLLIFIMTQAGSSEEEIDQFFKDASER
jgi:hypothetical protein